MTKRTVVCVCGAIWPWERFKKELDDCPYCEPEEWRLALNLGSNVKPIGFIDITEE